jgi:hypothetical protein
MNRIKIAIALVLLALAGVIVWQAWPSPEPVYKGKRLSEWLRMYATWEGEGAVTNVGSEILTVSMSPGATAALHHFGTDAIPALLRLVRTKDSALKTKLLHLARGQHIVKINTLSEGQWHAAAWYGFFELRTEAESAVPSLMEIADENISPSSRDCAMRCLDIIEPPRDAVPGLVSWVTNSDVRLRNFANRWLPWLDPEAAAKAGITNAPSTVTLRPH